MYKIDIKWLESEEGEVLAFCKKQAESFYRLKREIEKVHWADERYNELVDSMNEVGKALSGILQTLSDEKWVYAISELFPLAEQYLEEEKRFQMIC